MVNLVISTTLLMTNYRIRVACSGQLLQMHRDFMPVDDMSSDGDTADDDAGLVLIGRQRRAGRADAAARSRADAREGPSRDR